MAERDEEQTDKMDKDEKFILMGMDDAAEIADVLKNKTSRKILDYLADRKEASEKDIADGLNIPLNTVEYNLKKLISSRFVKKTGNFFWSVKGKKIPMYKLSRKHIVISPNKKPSLTALRSILPIILIAAILVAFMALSFIPEDGSTHNNSEVNLKQFKSMTELENFLKESVEEDGFWNFGGARANFQSGDMEMAVGVSESVAKDSAGDYSQTNIQVEGVDEADIVKNDGKYIYTVTGNKIVIVNAYPAKDMKILSEIEFEEWISEIFINEDKLIVFGGSYYGSKSESKVYIYDTTDKENLVLENEIGNDGNYADSRMIGDYVYVVYNKYIQMNNFDLPVISVNGLEREALVQNIYYPSYPDTNYVFNSIVAIDVNSGEVKDRVYLTGGSYNLHVSQNNIYLTNEKYLNYYDYFDEMVKEVYLPLVSEETQKEINEVLESDDDNLEKSRAINEIISLYSSSLKGGDKGDFDEALLESMDKFQVDLSKKYHKTVIHKIGLDEMDIDYVATGEVPGHVLNQFSMDESGNNFRIATTTGNSWDGNSLNHLYILDNELDIVGSVEDLAKGERIYSARFMGDRAYIVTFRQVDPLYVIDVSDPEDPHVLGYLKIPGYSDYLHPYDEDHLIGIGKEADENGLFQGLKISLFDVSDVSKPIEKHKIVIGDRGTNSPALYDHKAFLFDKERNLLVLPIELYEIDDSEGARGNYGKFVWQGAYIFDLSLNGISIEGKISHDNSSVNYEDYDYYWGNWNSAIKRSLYLDDTLYTISNYKLMANSLLDFSKISDVVIGEDINYPVSEWRTDIKRIE
jgi:inhibitor of cysteine peptidase